LPASDDSTQGLRARIDQLERGVAAGVVHASQQVAPATPATSVESIAAPAAAVPPAPPKLSAVAPKTAPSEATKKPPTKPPAKPATQQPVVADAPEIAAEPAQTPASPANPGNTTLASFVSMWPSIMDALLKYSRVAWMGFTDSSPLSYENGVLAVGVKDSGRYNNVKGGGHDERLRQSILDVLQVDCTIDVVLSSQGTPSAPERVEDTPSLDDETTQDVTGAALIAQELGGVSIGEIENG